jgi:RNA polymerase sigma-70 factor (ECF subfamily)
MNVIPLSLGMLVSRKRKTFEDVVRPELTVLYRVARRLCRNPQDAEDAVAQTLVNAYRAWGDFNGEYLRSWLITILRNEVRKRHRYDAARPDTTEQDEDVATDGFWEAVHWSLAVDRVIEELDALPEEFRLAVQLCDVEQMSYEEAAIAMGVPIGTVRSRLFRGRRQLRDRLVSVVEEQEVAS